MVVGDGHAFEGSNGFGGEDLVGRTPDSNCFRMGSLRFGRDDTGRPQLFRKVFLCTGTGDRNIQAEEIALRFTAGDVFGETGSVVLRKNDLLFSG